MRRRLAPLLLGLLISTGLQAQAPIHFSADVRAGQTYSHPIAHGLYLVLDQTDPGDWRFAIKPSAESQEDYTHCLGSPFLHGPQPWDLTAWRFAPDAGADWAEHLPVTKQIAFVTNAADQKYECAESNAIYDSFQRSQSAGRMPEYDGLPHYKPRPVGRARIVVALVLFKPGTTGKDAEFDRVALQVLLTFPKLRPATHP